MCNLAPSPPVLSGWLELLLGRLEFFLGWLDEAALESQRLAVQSLLLTPSLLLVVSLWTVKDLSGSSLGIQLSVRASASAA